MNKEKIDILIQIWDLCNTISQGIDHLLSNPKNETLADDIKAGLLSLPEYFANDSQTLLSITALNNALAIVSSEESPSEECLASTATAKSSFLSLVSLFLSKTILAEISQEEYITRDVAEQIFHFGSTAPHNTNEIYQLLFDTCNKSSLSAPLNSYETTMQLLEEQPGMLSGANQPHPNYVYRPVPQHTFERCMICGGSGTPYYRAFAYRMANFSHPHLPVKLWMKCNSCGNLYTFRYPEEQLELSLHSEIMLPNPGKILTTIGNTDNSQLSIWGDLLHLLSSYTKGKSLLEVGIGSGELLAAALEMEYNADAVEIVASSAERAANLLNIPVWNGDFLNYNIAKKYDIIIMGDVIEHITDPGKALDKARNLLSEDGVLWISTPNYESAFSRIHKFNDAMWSVSNHLTYFSYKGFRSFAEQHGLQVQEYRISKRYNGSMELILKKK